MLKKKFSSLTILRVKVVQCTGSNEGVSLLLDIVAKNLRKASET